MSLRMHLSCALAVATMSVAAVASACPNSHVNVFPPPGSTLTSATPIVIEGLTLGDLERRGPILWSNDDIVPLRVVVNHGSHIELAVDQTGQTSGRSLDEGSRYVLAVTRTSLGTVLPRAEAPLRHAFWVGSTQPRASSGFHMADHGGLSWAQGVVLFGLLPFIGGFGMTEIVLARRRRRALAMLL